MKKILSIIAILSLVFSPVTPAFAASASWTGGDPVNANWSDVDNWSASPVPGTGDTATFDAAGGAGGNTISLGATPGVTIGNMVFDNTGGNLGWYTIGAGGANHEALMLNAGGAITTNGNVVTDQTIDALITLSGAGSFVNLGLSLLYLNGSVDNNAHLLTVDSFQNITINGVISDAGSLTKIGPGALSLTGANTYTGVTTLSAGSVYVSTIGNGGVAGNLGQATAAATNLVLDGGSLYYQGTTASTNRGITVNATGGGIFVVNGGETLTFNTTGIMANGTLTIGGGGNTTISSAISGAGGLTQTDGGITTLSGTNTYTGVTTVNAGRLQIGKQVSLYNNTPASWTDTNIIVNSGATLAFNVGGTGEFTSANIDTLAALGTGIGGFMDASILGLDTTNASGGNFSYSTIIADTNGGANVVGLTKLGAGTLTLNGMNTYTGVTTLSAGTVSVDTIGNGGEAGNLGQATNSRWNQILDGGTLSYTGLTASTDRDFWIFGNGGGINVTTAGQTLAIQGDEIALDGMLTIGGAGDALISSMIFSGGGLTKDGAGTLTLSALGGVNSYNGATTISNGTLVLGVADVIPDGSAVTADGTLDMNGNSETIGSLAGAVGGLLTDSVAAPVTLTAGGDGTSTIFAGVIEDGSGVTSVTKEGAGALTLSGMNTYTGITTINAGALSIASTGALPGWDTNGRYSVASGATLAVYNAVASGDIVTMLGTTNFADGAALGFDTTTANYTYADILTDTAQGALGLTKLGSNTLTLSGANTYTGATTISTGTLALDATGTVEASSSIEVAGGLFVSQLEE